MSGPNRSTARFARASACVQMEAATLRLVKDRQLTKGDVLEVARLAGIMAAKQTGSLIPLCHPLPLEAISITFSFPDESTVRLEAASV